MESSLPPSEAEDAYSPFRVDYYNVKQGESLDFFIYVPHGGKVADFLAIHPDLEPALRVSRDKVEAICNLEEDTFTPELADAIAEILSKKGYRLAVMKVLIPREMVDVGRHEKLAIKPLFDFGEHPDILQQYSMYYHQIQAVREQLLGQLDPKCGKFLDLHTMRSFEVEGLNNLLLRSIYGENYKCDSNFYAENFDFSKVDWERVNWEEINEWYERRIEVLRAPTGVGEKRKHCMVVHQKNTEDEPGELKGDFIMVKVLSLLFALQKIPFGISHPYFLSFRMALDQIESYAERGILVDLVKEALAKNPNAGLECLEADPEKIEKYANILAKMLRYASIVTQFRKNFKL